MLTVWPSILARRPVLVTGVALLVSVGAVGLASRLSVDADLWRLLPPAYPSYMALEQLQATVGGENPVEVVIESPSFDANRAFAETLIPRVERMPGFVRVAYRRDVAFLRQHALYFATDAELDHVERFVEELQVHARRQANPLTQRSTPDSLLRREAEELRRAAMFLGDSEYPISPDSTVLVLRLYPAASQADLRFVEGVATALRDTVAALHPASFHDAMRVSVGGRFLQEQLEAAAVVHGVRRALFVALPAVLLVVVFYLHYRGAGGSDLRRLPALALVLGVPLAMSVIWTYALAFVAFGALNVVTATLGLVLFGMGVDYGLHFVASYAERRCDADVGTALAGTWRSTAGPIATSGATTAAGLFVLALADFRAFREFGVLAGSGVVLALVSTLVVLPALVVLSDRAGWLFAPRPGRRGASVPHALAAGRAWFLLPLGLALTAGSLVLALNGQVRFEYDNSRLTPEFPEYFALRRTVERVFPPSGRGNPAYIVAESAERVPVIVETLRGRMEADTTPTVLAIEALQDRFPLTDSARSARMARLAGIRAQLDRPLIRRIVSDDLDGLRAAAQTTAPIALSDVPRQLAAPFLARDGTLGNLVLVYPALGLSDARNSMAFAEDVGTVTTADGQEYHAASMSIVAADLIRLMQVEAPMLAVLSFTGIAILLLVMFRSFGAAGVALVPTALGICWMLGLMALTGIKLNFYNLAVLPVVLGVGNDAGVHLVHAFRHADPDRRLLALGGAAERVTVAAFTTALGFGALTLTGHPGIVSIGQLAVVGILATHVAALALVPPLLRMGRR